jgi:hypothetical protein
MLPTDEEAGLVLLPDAVADALPCLLPCSACSLTAALL